MSLNLREKCFQSYLHQLRISDDHMGSLTVVKYSKSETKKSNLKAYAGLGFAGANMNIRGLKHKQVLHPHGSLKNVTQGFSTEGYLI